MTKEYSAGAQVSAVNFAGEIALPPQILAATPDGHVKMQILKTMKWIVVHERAHGPIPRNHFAGESDNAAQLHATGFKDFKIADGGYSVHARNSITTVGSRFIGPRLNRREGITPKATNSKSTIASEAISESRRSSCRRSVD